MPPQASAGKPVKPIKSVKRERPEQPGQPGATGAVGTAGATRTIGKVSVHQSRRETCKFEVKE